MQGNLENNTIREIYVYNNKCYDDAVKDFAKEFCIKSLSIRECF